MHALSRNVVNSRRSSQAVSENASSTDYCYSDLTESNEKEGPSTPTAAFPIAIQPLDRDKAVPSSPTPAFPIAIQPSYGFRNMGGILRSLTNRSASKQGPTEGRFSVSPELPLFEPPSRPTTPKPPTPKKSALKRYEPLTPLPQTDPLPVNRDALEVLLNHHSTQLALLADRIEYVNEWIERDGCRLDCLMKEAERHLERDEAQRLEEAEKERVARAQSMLPSRPSTSFQSQTKRNAPASGVGFGELAPLTKEQVIHANLDIRDIRERILATKKLRIDLARSVHWQREEHLRIEKKLGIDPHMDASEPPQNVHEWGVGGRTWEKDWGRLPTSLEWKNMLCTSRFQWDENGTRRGIGAIR